MEGSFSAAYAAAGVNIEAGYAGVRMMREHVARTTIPGVLSDIGGFGGLFQPDFAGMQEPVLVSGTDGVGTKLRIAQLLDRHDTVGIDCVAMCANDIVCCGARPLFFLDYIAMGQNVPEKVSSIVAGVAEGCVQAGCALIGGETAEHPGTMAPADYDIAGFCVGVVDKASILDGKSVQCGDTVLALPSSGLHSNGFSLVRQVFDVEHADLHETLPELHQSLGEALLTPTRIYVKEVLAILAHCEVHGISHITGGGFYENLPRCIPDGLCALIRRDDLRTPPIFRLVQSRGQISRRDMFNTFNMGVGMALVLPAQDVEKAQTLVPDAYPIGTITQDTQKILFL